MNRFGRCAVLLVLLAAACAEGKSADRGSGGASAGDVGGAGMGTGGTAATGGRGVASGGATATGIGTGGAPAIVGTPITKVDLKGKRVLLVVDNPTGLNAGEIMLRDHLLVGREMVVTVADTTAIHADAATVNLIVASSSASGSEFPALYKAVAVPMILFGNSTYQAMGIIAASSGKGTVSTPVMLNIVTATTPLAAALGPGTSFSAIGTDRGTSVYWGTPGGSPINVATIMGAPTQSCVFGYEKDAAMAVGTAPARRVGLGFKTDVFGDLSIESFRLMNAAIDWTATAPP